MPLITAVTVTHNSGEVLPALLESLAREGIPAVVVDNASSDASVSVARAYGAMLVEPGANLGFGTASNRGVEAATDAQWCLLINPDAALEPGCGAALAAAIIRWPEAGILAPRVTEPDGRVFLQPRSHLAGFLPNPAGVRHDPVGDCCVPFVSGAAMLVRRELFLRMGGFDEAIFLFYEDDDLCRRMEQARLPVIWVNDARVAHRRGASSATPGFSFARTALVRHHQAASRAWVSRKWGVAHNPWPGIAVNGIKLLASALTLNRRRIARYWGSLTGAVAGLSARPPRRP
jgi:N-acetylglucosaminyl-diphospho-decaprenol L-rhamnosyltransferase